MKKTIKKNIVEFIDPADASLLGFIFQVEGGPLRNRLVERLTTAGKKHYAECLSRYRHENV